ncbi:DUF3089 domain-containing protein [Aurantivibrio infirmus]
MKKEFRIKYLLNLTALACVTCLTSVQAETAPADYSKRENWLCRSGSENLGACVVDNTATIVEASGDLSTETWQANRAADVDCFYVYPTVSLDATPNSDLVAGPEEYSVIKSQFARFASQCRVFAPMYRQISLGALRARNSTDENRAMPDRAMGYDDVLNAWNYYLQHDNNGRGVILVGHSQGSGVLTRLIAAEIDGKPIQKQIISAMLLGTNVQVPEGETVGGSFKSMPLCTSADQTQCIITYASFRSDVPPAENALFGRGGEGTVSACTNPAQLAKGNNELHSYLSASGRTGLEEWAAGKKVDTDFVSVPGLISSECVNNGSHSYLEVTVNGDPNDPRTDIIAGDVIGAGGTPDAGWGLHLIDVALAMGDLVNIAEKQIAAYQK